MILEFLKHVTSELDKKGIPYMLSGSLAMNVYTVPRLTRDIDIVIHLEESDIEKFSQIFAGNYYLNKARIKSEIDRKGMFNVIDFQSGQKLDFIVRKNSDFHVNEFERKIVSEYYGFPLWIVTIEDLIISKLKWIQAIKSDTQIRDLENLLSNQSIDMNYIKDWVGKMKLKTYNLI